MAEVPPSHQDLLNADVAVLATIARDGRPQQTAVWFVAEGDTVRISLASSRQKLKNLQANPKVGLLILDRANPYRYLELRGDAEIVPDENNRFAAKVGEKYHADLSSYDAPGDVRYVVTIKPARIYAADTGG